ncbi:MAG: D-amino acid dehydrogenase [Mesorhizobium sp.]|uniref:D-amino acid dehydrogenase n=1 Tax=Mesorhizobium sp. TaxID=1871066 RepID=UPI001208EC1A|nr:D-amino acid dehydrogenase [Mesorhizobium sp.]TIR52789.1 MAG: D-amino acid dehydrogenase [Mesorhizobium sp.]
MPKIAIIGAGITGVTTAYALIRRGYDVTLIDRQRYAAMETSFANGGQLSASNAEVWNSWGTVLKGLKWMLSPDAPLLVNPKPSWHKYSWFAEFLANIPKYRQNTIETTKLAILARQAMFEIAEREGIEFNLEKRGILHVYRDKASFQHAERVSQIYAAVGLERRPVTPQEIRSIEPALKGDFFGGFHTESDATGDIHLFTRGLAQVCQRLGCTTLTETQVMSVEALEGGVVLKLAPAGLRAAATDMKFDATVICAGIGTRKLASTLGDRINIYPVKGYSITVALDDEASQAGAPWVSLLDDAAKIVTSRLGRDRFRVAGTAEFNGDNMDIRNDRIQPLIKWIRSHFPEVATSKVVPWAGLRPMTPSMLPKVGAGRLPGIYYNSGHGHLGWTLSCATAEVLSRTVAANVPDSRSANLDASEV